MPKKQTVLYHYTSVEALYKIISTRTFWLANSKSSNDKKENSLSIRTYRKMLEDVMRTCQNDDINNAIRVFLSRKDSQSHYVGNKRFFILSLTTQKDNLAHWDRYASFRQGISIALNANILQMIHKKFPSIFQDDIIRICTLLYTKEDCVLKIRNELEKSWKFFNKRPKLQLNNILSDDVKYLFSYILSHFKNIFFKDETERRILIDEESTLERKEKLFSSIEMDINNRKAIEKQ